MNLDECKTLAKNLKSKFRLKKNGVLISRELARQILEYLEKEDANCQNPKGE